MTVDELIALLEPHRGEEVFMKCAWRNLDIKEVKLVTFTYAGDVMKEKHHRVLIVPDSGTLFDIFYD